MLIFKLDIDSGIMEIDKTMRLLDLVKQEEMTICKGHEGFAGFLDEWALT